MFPLRCSLLVLLMINFACGVDLDVDLDLIFEDLTTQPYGSWKMYWNAAFIYLIVSMIVFTCTFLICRVKIEPKPKKSVEPALKSVVINVHSEKERPRIINLSLRQTLPDRPSSQAESSDVAALERIISTKTARLKDMEREVKTKTARGGLSHREKALVREIAASTARSLREMSKKSKKSSKRSSKKSSSSSSSSTSSSSSSSSSPSNRSSRSHSSRRSKSSSGRSSDRSSRSSSRSSRRSSGRSSSRRSLRR